MSEPIRSYRDLIAWKKAYELGLDAHKLAVRLPEHERFGLNAQMRRSGTTIASQIAAAYGRGNTVEYIRGLRNARSTVYELDTQLLYCRDLNYLETAVYESLKAKLDESERVLAGLIQCLDR